MWDVAASQLWVGTDHFGFSVIQLPLAEFRLEIDLLCEYSNK